MPAAAGADVAAPKVLVVVFAEKVVVVAAGASSNGAQAGGGVSVAVAVAVLRSREGSRRHAQVAALRVSNVTADRLTLMLVSTTVMAIVQHRMLTELTLNPKS